MKEFGLTKRELLEEDAETVMMNLFIMSELNKAQKRNAKHGNNQR